jgi:hypothetical protein
MVGTSIQDLHKKEKMDQYESIRKLNDMLPVQYGAMQDMQHEQGHDAQHQMHQAQHYPYYASQNCSAYPLYTEPPMKAPSHVNTVPYHHSPTMALPCDSGDIEDLAKDISDNLGEDNFVSLGDKKEDTRVKGKQNSCLDFIPETLQEPLLLLLVFILLSQTVVKDTVGKYIKQINPDTDGKVSFVGILIYGVIFVVVFMLAKRFILE